MLERDKQDDTTCPTIDEIAKRVAFIFCMISFLNECVSELNSKIDRHLELTKGEEGKKCLIM